MWLVLYFRLFYHPMKLISLSLALTSILAISCADSGERGLEDQGTSNEVAARVQATVVEATVQAEVEATVAALNEAVTRAASATPEALEEEANRDRASAIGPAATSSPTAITSPTAVPTLAPTPTPPETPTFTPTPGPVVMPTLVPTARPTQTPAPVGTPTPSPYYNSVDEYEVTLPFHWELNRERSNRRFVVWDSPSRLFSVHIQVNEPPIFEDVWFFERFMEQILPDEPWLEGAVNQEQLVREESRSPRGGPQLFVKYVFEHDPPKCDRGVAAGKYLIDKGKSFWIWGVTCDAWAQETRDLEAIVRSLRLVP